VSVNGSAPITIFDPTNPYSGETPAQLTAEIVNGPNGQRLGLKVHLPNATVVVLLAKDDATAWRDAISGKLAEMNGLILPGG
jgi:hypothetical protein